MNTSNKNLFAPLNKASLKERLLRRFQQLIFSGELKPGQQLPPERELARQFGVGRPAVHEALVELQAKGLVEVQPRRGTVVRDYRREGSLALLSVLASMDGPSPSHPLLASILELWDLLNRETAVLAARRRSADDVAALRRHLRRELEADPNQPELLMGLDFTFYHLVAVASGNTIYPLLFKSCEAASARICAPFYRHPEIVAPLLEHHRVVTWAIEQRDEKQALSAMNAFLSFGREELIRALSASSDGVQPGTRQEASG